MNIDLESLLAVDVETSGPSPYKHQLLSVSFVPFSETRAPFNVFIMQRDIFWGETAKTYFQGWSQEWNRKAVPADVAFQQICGYLNTFSKAVTLVGHNVAFDYYFLLGLANQFGLEQIPNISHRKLDTHSLLFVLNALGKIPDTALSSSGAFEAMGIHIPDHARHTSIEDAKAAKELFVALLDRFEKGDRP